MSDIQVRIQGAGGGGLTSIPVKTSHKKMDVSCSHSENPGSTTGYIIGLELVMFQIKFK